jgi:hypothetical protein
VDIGFAIGSITRLQVPRVRVENGWALGKFAGGFAQARRLTLGSSNLVYFCEPTLRTQLHISVCGLNVVCCETAIGPELGAKRKCRARAQNVADDPKPKSLTNGASLEPKDVHYNQEHTAHYTTALMAFNFARGSMRVDASS